jgi:hypothetical protein
MTDKGLGNTFMYRTPEQMYYYDKGLGNTFMYRTPEQMYMIITSRQFMGYNHF